MELKRYQKEVIADIERFIEQVDVDNRLDTAYRNFWTYRGVDIASLDGDILRPYDNSVKGVPRVTVKVPTAGGKTFIACNALRSIFNNMPSEIPKVVTWFVPSDAILNQTYKNLSNPNHPYRQKIDSHFGSVVRVVDKESALMGHGISPTEVQEQLTIFVLSVQSFIEASRKGLPRAYRENSNLAAYAAMYDIFTKRVEGSDETGLIQVISYLKPVVIIDESHNFEADLRVNMLNALNPCFILDLTATPRNKSNIISFVDAVKLKNENMVKLPVIVYNHKSSNDVLASAINLQRNLEQKAIAQEAQGGKYIRPIVLFQAQPKSSDDKITFDKIKAQLIEIGIPEEQIKIKIGGNDGLKNIDLLSRDCPVRYIITVNALKEGWDCPFAYILASLANKSSKVDVEQILGRVLRLPYTTQHREELLNLSYVFTSSANFRDTLENIIKSLNRAGFSKKDYRLADKVIEDVATTPSPTTSTEQTQNLFSHLTEEDNNMDNSIELDVNTIKASITSKQSIESNIAKLEDVALQANSNYIAEIEATSMESNNTPNDLEGMVKRYKIKDIFAKSAAEMTLPIFVRRVNVESIFESAETYIPLTKSDLTEDFDLSKEDHKINFVRTEIEAEKIDLEESGSNEFTPTHNRLEPTQLARLRDHFISMSSELQREQLSAKIAHNININEIPESQITKYIKMAIEDCDNEKIEDLWVFETQTTKIVKDKIEELLTIHRKKKFNEWLSTGKIRCGNDISLPSSITLTKVASGLSKCLYTEADGDINKFEYRLIKSIADLDNVLFWHKNSERRKEFMINGHINHYPDFIVRLKSGYTIIIETKGDHLDNSNSRHKLDLGHKWVSKAGEKYRYFMVFDKTHFEEEYTIDKIIDRLKQM